MRGAPEVEVEKAKDPKLRVRGNRPEDRAELDKFAGHPMVIRGLGSGVFEGLYPWVPRWYQEHLNADDFFPIVCEDETTGEPMGLLDLYKMHQDVMQHTMGLSMFVKPEYQGIGVGTMLMEDMKILARRLHLAQRVRWEHIRGAIVQEERVCWVWKGVGVAAGRIRDGNLHDPKTGLGESRSFLSESKLIQHPPVTGPVAQLG